MRLLEALSTQSFLQATGWALLHSLWQGAIIALVLAAVLKALKGRSPNARYVASCAALALMLIAPAATALRDDFASQTTAANSISSQVRKDANAAFSRGPVMAAEEFTGAQATGAGSVRRSEPLVRSIEGVLPWVSLLWTLGVLLLTARTIGGLVVARRLAREGTADVSAEWRERFAEIARRLRATASVRLLESSLVRVPATVGWLKPVVLVPASALAGLTPLQLEALIAHELAHVRRHDYLVNLIQTVVETLLFYHPAAWWVSRRVREEREHACDDMAVEATRGGALQYARALAQMERLRREEPRMALAANGGSLRARVVRLVGAGEQTRGASPVVVAFLFLVALFTTVACTHAALSGKNAAELSPEATAQSNANVADDAKKKAPVAVNPKMPREVAALIEADNVEGEDMEVRRAAIDALGARAGSVVVMDPKTGRVYTVVNQDWAIRRGWLPASTTKVVVGLAGMGEKMFDPSAKVKVKDRTERLDLTDALALSNTPYFISLGDRIGSDAIISYSRRLGYGEPTGINIDGEVAGRLPATSSVKTAGWLGAHGEGIEVTPIQLATIYSAIANGGTLLVPRVPRTAEEAARFEPRVRRQLDIPRGFVRAIVPGLVAAVERGTGSEAKSTPVKVAGKTGSANGHGTSHGIFVSYAPADDPRLVVVVVTQGKGENGPGAAGVAGSIYKALSGRL